MFSQLRAFIGKQIIDCEADIERIAKAHGYTVNVMDPTFNNSNIMTDPHRVNIHTDGDSIIRSVSIG